MIYPHELFAMLYAMYPDQFGKRILGGDTNNLKKFWADMSGHPCYNNHPMKARLIISFWSLGLNKNKKIQISN